ncbi:MAG TPA: GNAT family N-acetyltransferase [Devosia sp.]|nr:GNAT family N-acetyltransferase [Devosia sp.]
MNITYAAEPGLTADDYIAVIGSTYMAGKRAVHNRERIAEILKGSNLLVSARAADGTIVGVARGISDGAWVCYLADLCVREGWQRRGIGSRLLETCYQILGPRVGLVLLAYPEAVEYYRRIGMGEMAAFFHPRGDEG